MSRADDITLLASFWRNELNPSQRLRIENRKKTDMDFRQLAEEIRDIVTERPTDEADEILELMLVTDGDVQAGNEPLTEMQRKDFEHKLSVVKHQERQRRKTVRLMMILALFFLALIVTLLVYWLQN